MSTRSGKRLHNSSNENIEPELASKIDRKTRGKRVLENGDGQEVLSRPKKRQNYVSFPTDEETPNVNPLGDEYEVQLKPIRALRRNTLKEQNATTAAVETKISTKKQMRSTRHTKRLSETATDKVSDIVQNENLVDVTITNGKPKVKKNKKKSKKITQHKVIHKQNDEVVKKKNNKKSKNSKSNSSLEQQETSGKINYTSGVSTDSFHGAAGSPAHQYIMSPLNKSSPNSMCDTDTLPIHNVSGNKKRRTSLKGTSELNTSTTVSMEVDEDVNTNIKNENEIVADRESKQRRSSLKNIMPDEDSKLPHTVDKVDLNATFEKEPLCKSSNKKKRKSNIVESSDVPVIQITPTIVDVPKISTILNTTFEKDEKGKKTNNISCHEQLNVNSVNSSQSLNSSFEKRRSPRKSMNASENTTALNGTFDLSPKPDLTKHKSLDSTFDKETKLDLTFDKTAPKEIPSSKSSLISSDATNSSIVTLDKSDEHSKISITDDDSKTENILNTTPLLIESSMEESKILEGSTKKNKTPESQPATTPLKREGTFTKEAPEVSTSPKQTPNKRQTLPAAGCTPYHSNGKGYQKRSLLNLTHSIEKPGRRSSSAEAPRAPRVMFCSPVNNPGVATQRKSRIIKSNLKGSNKSFVFDESVSSPQPARSRRKRSPAQAAEAGAAKRSRLAPAAPAPAPATAPAERRARCSSQPTILSSGASPAPAGTPAKPRSELKATRLPDFAALHARRFQRMESLDECQRRRAQRARRLLVPTGGLAVLQRSSPRVTLEAKARDSPVKAATPAKTAPLKLPTLDTLQRGYTRFGFKMHCEVNPFSVPSKIAEKKPKETKPSGLLKPNGVNKSVVSLKRQVIPSLAGATSLRKEAAKQTILREKSFTLAEKRNESRKEVRTVIKGVRTNRRFELQMRSRNING